MDETAEQALEILERLSKAFPEQPYPTYHSKAFYEVVATLEKLREMRGTAFPLIVNNHQVNQP
jgi:hypothetical protein